MVTTFLTDPLVTVYQTALIRDGCVKVICASLRTQLLGGTVQITDYNFSVLMVVLSVYVLARSHDSLLSREGHFSTAVLLCVYL
jgi:hypothetical protein